MAIDSTEEMNQFIDWAILAKNRDALGIPMASSIEFDIFNDVSFVSNRHRSRANPRISMDVGFHVIRDDARSSIHRRLRSSIHRRSHHRF